MGMPWRAPIIAAAADDSRPGLIRRHTRRAIGVDKDAACIDDFLPCVLIAGDEGQLRIGGMISSCRLSGYVAA